MHTRKVATLLLSAIAGLGFSSAASAQDDATGFYVGLNVGSSSINDVEITYYDLSGTFGGTGTRDEAVGVFDAKSAIGFGGSIGYDFGMLRTDLELAYAKNKIDTLTLVSVNGSTVTLDAEDRADVCDYLEVDPCGGSGSTFQVDGARIRQLSAMANAWIDLPVGSTIVPYAGGGLGVSGFETDGEGKAKFAWQIGAGLAVNLSSSAAVTLDYRHREVGGTSIAWDDVSGFELSKLKTDTIAAGVRFTF